MSELDLREQIARWLVQYSDRSDYSWGELSSSTHNMFLRRADNLIQSLNLVQLDPDQSLPEISAVGMECYAQGMLAGARVKEKLMRLRGFRRIKQ